ncbi:Reticulon-like protein B9 [Bienertia sinuspersici]
MSSTSEVTSNPNNGDVASPTRISLFGRRRPIHEVLGGGQVADVLLWRMPEVSTVLLMSIITIWLLFEIAKYSFVTLVCQISITTMLVFFIWCTLAKLFNWKIPQIPEIIMHETTFEQAAIAFHARFNQYLAMLLNIACGKDIRLFFLTIGCLLMVSIIGKYISSLNLLFISYTCMQVLPFLYEKYEDDVDYIVGEIYQEMKKWYKKFDENILGKLPRGSIQDRKRK